MSNKAQRVGSSGPYSTRRSRVLYYSYTVHIHAITIVFHLYSTKLWYMTKVAVLYDSYSTATSFDPLTLIQYNKGYIIASMFLVPHRHTHPPATCSTHGSRTRNLNEVQLLEMTSKSPGTPGSPECGYNADIINPRRMRIHSPRRPR